MRKVMMPRVLGTAGRGVLWTSHAAETRRKRKCPARRVPDEPTLRLVRDLGGSASVPCLLPAPGFSPIRARAPYDAMGRAVNPERRVLSHFRKNRGPKRPSTRPAR